MHFIIPVLMCITIICMRKLDIENKFKVFVILCVNLFVSFIITAQCRGTEAEMLAMIFFVANVLIATGSLYWRMAKDLPTYIKPDPNAKKKDIMELLFGPDK